MGAQRRAPGGGKRGWGDRAPVPISARKCRKRHKAFEGKVSCSREEGWRGNLRSVVQWSPQRALGAGEMDARCLPPCVAGMQLGARGGLRPPPSFLAWLPAPPGGGRACPPARPARSFSPPLGGDGGAPGPGQGNAARCGCRGALRSGSSWGSAGLRWGSGRGAEGTAPSCGAWWGPAGVLRARFGLRGRRALALVPPRSALRAQLQAGVWRCRPKRGGCGGRAGEVGVADRGAARRGRGGEARSGRRRDGAAARAAAWLSCSLARSRGPRPARRSPDTGKRRAQPHSPPEGGAALGPKEPRFRAPSQPRKELGLPPPRRWGRPPGTAPAAPGHPPRLHFSRRESHLMGRCSGRRLGQPPQVKLR